MASGLALSSLKAVAVMAHVLPSSLLTVALLEAHSSAARIPLEFLVCSGVLLNLSRVGVQDAYHHHFYRAGHNTVKGERHASEKTA